MTDRKRRRDWPFDDDLFEHFEEIFEDMRRRMEKMMSQSFRDIEPLEREKPFVWGYSVRIGPDGKPQFRQFGDTQVFQPRKGGESRREPMVDILERDDTISITAELPGVEKQDVDLRATQHRLVISVDHPERRYYKELDLPAAVNPESVKATYKNGILDITLTKSEEGQGKRVPIE